jgi:hypothetical protein
MQCGKAQTDVQASLYMREDPHEVDFEMKCVTVTRSAWVPIGGLDPAISSGCLRRLGTS